MTRKENKARNATDEMKKKQMIDCRANERARARAAKKGKEGDKTDFMPSCFLDVMYIYINANVNLLNNNEYKKYK